MLYHILPAFVALSVKEISVGGTCTDSGAAKDSNLVGCYAVSLRE